MLQLHLEGLFLLVVPVGLRGSVALFLSSLGLSQSCGSVSCLLFATYPFLPVPSKCCSGLSHCKLRSK